MLDSKPPIQTDVSKGRERALCAICCCCLAICQIKTSKQTLQSVSGLLSKNWLAPTTAVRQQLKSCLIGLPYFIIKRGLVVGWIERRKNQAIIGSCNLPKHMLHAIWWVCACSSAWASVATFITATTTTTITTNTTTKSITGSSSNSNNGRVWPSCYCCWRRTYHQRRQRLCTLQGWILNKALLPKERPFSLGHLWQSAGHCWETHNFIVEVEGVQPTDRFSLSFSLSFCLITLPLLSPPSINNM